MPHDFYEITNKNIPVLNQTELKLFDYVVKNMEKVKGMSIQKLAAECFLSTTTIFRFTQKLGFSGYSEFINSLLITYHQSRKIEIPNVITRKVYSEEYLKNVMEAVRVMPANKVAQIHQVLAQNPHVYIITDEQANDIGRYCEKLFMGAGLRTYFPEVGYQIQAVLDLIKDEDLLIILSYSGEDASLVDVLGRIYLDKKPFMLSITRADNNMIQNMSDVNFYMFADEIIMNNINLTSHVGVMMIIELLIYDYIARK